MFADSVEYERLTQSIYQAVLRSEGATNIEVKHDLEITGKSGVAHQVDVSWRFRVAGVEHHVLVECKNFGKPLTLEKVRNFFAVLHDIGNCQGIMVTKTGYQSGVVGFAKHYGIGLKLLRKPSAKDWEGRLKDIEVSLDIESVASSPGKWPKVFVKLAGEDGGELKTALEQGDFIVPPAPEMVFVDSKGIPLRDEMRWWLSRELLKDHNPVGGPYRKALPCEGYYLELTKKDGSTRLTKVASIEVEYHIEVLDTREFLIAGEDVVQTVLKDFNTGEWEHTHREGPPAPKQANLFGKG